MRDTYANTGLIKKSQIAVDREFSAIATESASTDREAKSESHLGILLDCNCLLEILTPPTAAELEVATMFVNGHTYSEIAIFRRVTIDTVKSQVASVLSKTGTTRRTDLIKHVLLANIDRLLGNTRPS